MTKWATAVFHNFGELVDRSVNRGSRRAIKSGGWSNPGPPRLERLGLCWTVAPIVALQVVEFMRSRELEDIAPVQYLVGQRLRAFVIVHGPYKQHIVGRKQR